VNNTSLPLKYSM